MAFDRDKQSKREQNAIKISATLARIIYHNEDKGNFLIGIFHADPPVEYLGSTMTVVGGKGSVANPQIGLKYSLTGKWEKHARYGDQFSFWEYASEYPAEADALVQYLDENAKWLGRKRAKAIVDKFGAENAIEICKDYPRLLVKHIDGITTERAEEIRKMLVENEQSENLQLEIKDLFKGIRIARKVVNAITKEYKKFSDPLVQIAENPYALIEQIPGVGFLTADELAKKLGFALDGPPRIRAGLVHVLSEETYGAGNCYVKDIRLAEKAATLLKLPVELCGEQIHSSELTSRTKLIPMLDKHEQRSAVYLPQIRSSESTVVVRLMNLMAKARPSPELGVHPNYEGLNAGQRDGLQRAIDSGVFVLTGAPGTGKTHLMRYIIEAFSSCSLKLCAPTGRAAKRITELTSMHASTIHRLLEPVMDLMGELRFARHKDRPIDAHVIIVDEFSMCDIWLAAKLFDAIADGTRIVIVGDSNQLPSVGPGNVLRDIIRSGVIPSVELTEIMRQDPGLIVTNCSRIKRGEMIEVNHVRKVEDVKKGIDDRVRTAAEKGSCDFYFFHKISEERIRDTVFELVTKQLPALGYDPMHQVQVLAPLRHRTLVSCDAFNTALQDLLNPVNESNGVVKHEGIAFRNGDKVIQRRNQYQYDIINGDIGFVEEVNRQRNRIVVNFVDPDRAVDLPLFDNDLELAYACTVHAYQGSECPAIIIPIHKAMGNLIMQRPLIYTAISRAQRLCILVGQKTEIERAIFRDAPNRRNTRLAKLLGRGVALLELNETGQAQEFAMLNEVEIEAGDDSNREHDDNQQQLGRFADS